MKRKLTILEILVCILIIVVAVISFLTDKSVISIQNILIDRIENSEEFYFTLFSVQASVATMSIAIISIVTGVLNDTVYGVSVSKFITNFQTPILKQKYLIIASLIIIAANYICVSLALFNSSTALFVISIIINAILTKNTCKVFSGKDEINKLIKEYLSENYNEQMIDCLTQEIKNAVESGNSIIIKNDYEAYKSILQKEIDKGENINTDITKYISEAIANIFTAIVKTHDSKEINDCIKFVCDIYDKANAAKDKPLYLDVWSLISSDFFSGLKDLTISQLQEDSVHIKLREKLLININGISSDKLKKIDIYTYSAKVYLTILDTVSSEKHDIITYFYKKVFPYYKDIPVEFRIKELCYLNRVAIEKGDCDILSQHFFKHIKLHDSGVNDVTFVITTIYLYYLSVRKEMVEGKPLQLNAKKIIEKNKNCINEFLYSINIFDIITNYYEMIYSMMCKWEYIEPVNDKLWIFDSVIEDYFIFSALNDYKSQKNLKDILIKITTPSGISSIYLRYFSDGNKNDLTEKYQQFSNLFAERFNEQQTTVHIDKLKSLFEQIYKEEIKNATINAITDKKLQGFEEKCKSLTWCVVKNNFEIFSFDKSNNNLSDRDITSENIEIYNDIIPYQFFGELEYYGFEEYLKEYILYKLISNFIQKIESGISIKNKNYNDEDKLETIINEVKSLGISPDIYIGDENPYWNEKDNSKLNDYVQKMKKIILPEYQNDFILLDSNMISFEVKNIDVEISDVSYNDLEGSFKNEGNGKISFKVTDNIYLPFNDTELKEYLHNTKRKLIIHADVNYKLPKEKKVGVKLQLK